MRKSVTFICAALVCASMLAQTPDWVRSGDGWDATTYTLYVNSNPPANAYTDMDGVKHIARVVIGTGVTNIGSQAFVNNQDLQELVFAEGSNLDTIAMMAFETCRFDSLELPASVDHIGISAFGGNSNLTTVTLHSAHCTTSGAPFDYGTYGCQLAHIYVPSASEDWYKHAMGWSDFAAIIAANPVPEPATLTVTFAANTDSVEGTVPAALEIANGGSITIPTNRTLYKAGHTLTGWSDGAHIHAIDSTYTPSGNSTLTAVFTPNQASVLEADADVTVAWDLLPSNGAPSIAMEHGALVDTAILVAQASWSGYTVDVKLDIDATANGAKFNNTGNATWAQVNQNTKFRFISKPRAILKVYTYVDPSGSSTLDGWFCDTWNSNEATFTASGITGTSELVNNELGQWYRWIKVTYPSTDSSGIDEVNRQSSNRKFIKDGQLLIEKNGKVYNAQGVEVK